MSVRSKTKTAQRPAKKTKPPAKAAAKGTSSDKPAAKASGKAKSAETPRSRAETVSQREETPRTKAPTIRGPVPAENGRSRRDTILDPAPSTNDTFEAATTGRWQARPSIDDRHDLDDDNAADPARAMELASLESRIDDLEDPDVLVAIASQIDTLGMQLAFEISKHAHDADHVAPLKPVLMRVPAVYGRALVRAAEKYDDKGSPKRAAYVLFEALRKAFDPAVIHSMSDALAFVLEAHDQGSVAVTLRKLVQTRDTQRAEGVDRKVVRAQFSEALTQLRDHGIDWNALDDDPVQFD